MHGKSALLLLLGFLSASSCSGREAPTSVARHGANLDVLDRFPTLRARWHDRAELHRSADGASSATDGAALSVALPSSADGALRVSLSARLGAWIDIRALGARHTLGAMRGNAMLYSDVFPSTDVIELIEHDRVEEVRIVRKRADRVVARYVLTGGPAIRALRARDSRIEAIDEKGTVVLSSEPMIAIDARGEQRPVNVAVRGEGPTLELETSLDARGLEPPIAIDPAWTSIASMNEVRVGHYALSVGDKVYVFNGQTKWFDNTTNLTTAEVYDATTNTWTRLAAPASAAGVSVKLEDGRFMFFKSSPMAAILYDPTTDVWSTRANPSVDRQGSNYVPLKNGKVLREGGFIYVSSVQVGFSTTELYDPATDSWRATTGSMSGARFRESVTRLGDGRVLVSGGTNGDTALSTVEVFDPTTETWSSAGALTRGRLNHVGAQLSSGKVLVFSGTFGLGLMTTLAELYDPASGTSTPTGSPAKALDYRLHATVFSDSAVLGCDISGYCGLYAPASAKWFDVTPSVRREGSARAAISGDRVVATGGRLVGTGLETSTVEVFGRVSNGQACTSAAECQSLVCVDGVCCNRTCDSPCEACDLTASKGTCTAISGTPRHGTCGAYRSCNAGSCASTCAADTDCASTHYCTSGVCALKLTTGNACTAGRMCASGACVDGFCCNTSCSSQCMACDVTGSEGKCVLVRGSPHGTRTACGGVGVGTACGATCDGIDGAKCNYPGSTTACSANACTAGTETHAQACAGNGLCLDVPKSCGAYACGTTTCKSSCGSSADCAKGFHCAGSACVPVEGLGKDCAEASTCATGNCVDGVCCATASCGAGGSCAVDGKRGTCTKTAGAPCAAAAECGTGYCVDGVCCASLCDGVCEACDVSGRVGSCAPVVGAPRGGRPACPTDTSNPCATKTCDGTETKSCSAFVGAEVTCRPASCKEGSATPRTQCDGKGACPEAVASDCGGLACTADGVACKTSCAADTDCLATHTCEAGACKPRTAKCSDDGAVAIAVDSSTKPCAPFACRGGACLEACATTGDCTGGTVCDLASQKCRPPSSIVVEEDTGGCSTSSRPVQRGDALTFVLVIGAALTGAARRRGQWLLAIAASLVAACSDRVGSREPKRAPEDARAAAVIATLRGFPPFERALSRNVQSPWSAASESLVTSIASGAAGGAHVELAGDPQFSLEVVPLDVANVVGSEAGGAVVFAGAARDVDIVHIVDRDRMEEVRLLRSEHAERSARYALRVGPAVRQVRARDERIELLDANGVARIRSEPMFAIDSKGRRSSLRVALRGSEGSLELDVALDAPDLSFPVAVDPSWTTTASLAIPRRDHAGARLPGGKVIVAWGMGPVNNQVTQAEIYDSATKSWTFAKLPPQPLYEPLGIELSDGRAMFIGLGTGSYVYNSTTDTWSSRASSVRDGIYRPLVLLASGKVLAVGGRESTNAGTTISELYDPATNTWTSTGNLVTGRASPIAVKLADGRVLAVGGYANLSTGTKLSTAELYDPSLGTWTTTGSARAVRTQVDSLAVTLTSGKVLVAGSSSNTAAELFDPSTGTFSPTKWSPRAVSIARFAVLGSGRLLISGGAYSSTGEVYDPTIDAWAPASQMNAPRGEQTMTLLPSGGVLSAGGLDAEGAIATAEIFTPLPNGASCTYSGDCASFACVDGFCCDRGCTGACEICNATGKEGTCTGITGPQPSGKPSCSPYLSCVAGSCATSCSADEGCAATSYCDTARSCVTKKSVGLTCTRARECQSGFCVDGFCCGSACAGQCESCSGGTCRPVKGSPIAPRPPCAGLNAGTTCGIACNGVDTSKCNYPTGGTCSAAACSAGIETHASTCDGAGSCSDIPKNCSAYACGPTACKTSCTTRDDCAPGFQCSAGACIPTLGLGKSCATALECASGFCTEGVCCGVAACDAGASCAVPERRGTCTKPRGATCSSAAECGSGNCVDGVCCESKCSGQCEACDVAGRVGLCTAVVGAPRGTREKCTTGGTDACATTLCDGRVLERCAAFVAAEVACRESSCTDGVVTRAATCDGSGRCPSPITSSCAGFACDGAACKTTCASAADCVAGFVCDGAGKCTRAASVCASDGLSVISASGTSSSCAPYRCNGGKCLAECQSTADCQAGLSCDPTTHGCATVVTEEGGGGCAMASTHDARRAGWPALLLCAILAGVLRTQPCASRRRRRSTRTSR